MDANLSIQQKRTYQFWKGLRIIVEIVKFPQEEDFLFFNQQKVSQMIKNVQKCQAIVKQNKFSINTTKLLKYNTVNRSSLSNDVSGQGYSDIPSNLQRQINQKQSALNQYKQEIGQLRQQKSFLIKQFENQKNSFQEKMQEYQKQLQKLYYQVKYLRKKLKTYENPLNSQNSEDSKMMLFNSSISSDRSDVMDLRDKIKLLIRQNMNLKQQNSLLQKKVQIMQGENLKEGRKKLNLANTLKKQLMQELLKNDCNENKQFQIKSPPRLGESLLTRVKKHATPSEKVCEYLSGNKQILIEIRKRKIINLI